MLDEGVALQFTVGFAATDFTPTTSLSYTAGSDGKVREAFAEVNGRRQAAKVTADIPELVFRYRQKQASSATFEAGGRVYRDPNGDGYAEVMIRGRSQKIEMWRALEGSLAIKIDPLIVPQYLYDFVRDVSCDEARHRSFVATCGSTAARIHAMHGHSVLWASIPPGREPNEIHRHMGGNVYCLFYRGEGRFHRVDPQRGFETLPVRIGDQNTFQMIAIPTHLWYQPVNTGLGVLEYFMVHEPAFDSSELLKLDRNECPEGWGFEF
jgi:mannose-6-phosphate isomerase-like protein (cupin superfamily)